MRSIGLVLLIAIGTSFAAAQEKGQGKAPTVDYQKFFYAKVSGQETGRIQFEYGFDDEAEILDWEAAGEGARVHKGSLQLEGEALLVHRFPFSKEMEVEVSSKRMRSISVELAGNGMSEETGYRFRLEPGDPPRCVVTRAGDDWLAKDLESGTLNKAVVSLAGGTISVAIDGEEIFKKTDPEPIEGDRVMLSGGAKDLAIDGLAVRGGFDPKAVEAASLKKLLPKDRWIPLLDSRGLSDFRVAGPGWSVEKGALVFKGDKKKNGWALRKEIDPTEISDYVVEMEIRTDSRRWLRRREGGVVSFGFNLGGKNTSWIFHNIASLVRGVDSTRSHLSLAKGRWHQVRVTVKGGKAEGVIDGKRAWVLEGPDSIVPLDERKERGFVFGCEQGPTYFRNIRLKVTE